MTIIAADDERIALKLLVSSIQEAVPEAQVNGFDSGEKALEFGTDTLCEVAFLDIDMNDMDGIQLAKHKIWVQCFGNFEVFADGVPIKVTYSKTKELLSAGLEGRFTVNLCPIWCGGFHS